MSAFGGVLHFDRQPFDRHWVSAFGKAHDTRGPDGGADAIAGAAAMVARWFHVTPEDRFDRQPAHDGNGTWLCWDGRLDNANDLEAAVGRTSGPRTDTHLILSAYRRFDTNVLPRIVGDFALALWDAPRRRLTLARDCVGARTLYFHCDSRRVIWSTDLEVLMRFGDIPCKADEDFIADFLVYEVDPGRSPFHNVHSVRPAEAVTITVDGRCERRPFWTLDVARDIRHRKDEDYARHFEALFREAVRVRLRTYRPVAAELSGGLDSSSIVLMADAIVGAGGIPRVETVSRVHEDSRSSDERRFIDVVERRRGRSGLHLTDAVCPLFEDLDRFAEQILPNPFCFAASYHAAADEWIRDSGARVLLSGLGGDEIVGSRQNPAPQLGDLLMSWRLRQLVSSAIRWSDVLHEPLVVTLYRHALMQALPMGIRRRQAARRAASQLVFCAPEYVRRARLVERLAAGLEPVDHTRPSVRDQASGFVTVVSQIANGFRRAMCSADVTYPFLHRPLVEFMQAIPIEQKVRPGQTRIVQRAALASLLPDAILRRRTKGNPTESLTRAFRRSHGVLSEWLRDGCLARRGYIDPSRVQAELSRLAIGAGPTTLPLVRLLTLELWFRALDTRARELRPSAMTACSSDAAASGALRRGNTAVPEREVTRSTA